MAINDELKEVYLNANVNKRLVRTVTLTHPSFSKVWYLVQSNTPFDGKLENGTLVTYQPHGFNIKLPDETTKGQSNTQFVIDATEKTTLDDYWAFMNDPTIPIKLDWREYFTTSPEIQTSILNIKLMDIEFNYNQIQGAGSRPDIVNRAFLFRRYDQTILKGLKYV